MNGEMKGSTTDINPNGVYLPRHVSPPRTWVMGAWVPTLHKRLDQAYECVIMLACHLILYGLHRR